MDPTAPNEPDDTTPPAAAQSTMAVNTALIAEFIGAVADRDDPLLRRLLRAGPPADIADVIEYLSPDLRHALIEITHGRIPGEVLVELTSDVRAAIVEQIAPEVLADAIRPLESDDQSLILADLEEPQRLLAIAASDAADRSALEQSFAFDEETAARLTQREFAAAPEHWTVGQTIDHLRAQAEDLPDVFFEVYVVNPRFAPIGAIAVSQLLRQKRDVTLRELMAPPAVIVHPETDQEDVAHLFRKYHLASAPVVDEAGRLVGMITVDDIVDVISDEKTEDMLALHGVSQVGDTAFGAIKARAPWLFVNMGTAIGASIVVSLFAETIEQKVALAVLMPTLAALGGNAGAQALAVAVRALAARELNEATGKRAVFREFLVGLSNGLLFATLLSAISMLWFGDWKLAGVIFAAMFGTFLAAGLAGILVPLGLKRAGADPAVASSVFVLTITDLTGFFLLLGLASLLLR